MKSDSKPFRNFFEIASEFIYICIYMDILSTFDGPNFKRLCYVHLPYIFRSVSIFRYFGFASVNLGTGPFQYKKIDNSHETVPMCPM